jgi:ribosome-associated heat shock protein Hsp15
VAGVRIDRWLCAARVLKSRTQATQACVGGRVKINDAGVKPNALVKIGDTVRVQADHGLRILEVTGLAEKRQSPALARTLFTDRSPPPEPRPTRMPRRDLGAGRPTKRERRDLQRFRGRE